MTKKPILYTSPGSQHCRRVMLLIHEAKLDIETKTVDVRPPGMGGENESVQYLELNPNAKVPVLTHDETVLTESNAIMYYLSDLYKATKFWPSKLVVRSKIISWQFWQAAHLSPAADGLMVENMLKPLIGQKPNEAAVSQLKADFLRWAQVLETHLDKHEFLVGSELTCADLSVASALMYMHAAQLPLREHKAVCRWFHSIRNRPSWKDTEPPAMD